jgi:uncharacterized protein YkwD
MGKSLVIILVSLLPLLAACGIAFERVGSVQTRQLAATPAPLNAKAAAAMVSGYRKSRGLPAVALDSKLMKIAADHAHRMAAADRMAHVLPGEGSFQRRLSSGGFEAAAAAENIGAGYDTLEEAMAAWRTSRTHNANLLKRGVTRMGIASAYAPGSRYRVYWSLVLAEPYVPPPPGSWRFGPIGPASLFGPPPAVPGQ